MKAIAFIGLAGLCGMALVGSVACGGSPSSAEGGSTSGATKAGTFTMVSTEVRTEADLPTCRSENDGARAIVASTGTLQECTGREWTAIASTFRAGETVAYNTSTETLSVRSDDSSTGAARWMPASLPRDPSGATGTAPDRLFFDTVGRNSSNWELQTIEREGAVAPAPVAQQAQQSEGVSADSMAAGPGVGEVACRARAACTLIAVSEVSCIYLCYSVTYGP